ncbi:MAG: hypothetical protein LC800_06430 [Acidobacteria bacterium]|nr:hypothetical protein [Acidobacteriota bacterium]
MSGVVFQIGRALLEEIGAHAREASPAECCGLVGGSDGRARSGRILCEPAPAPGRL